MNARNPYAAIKAAFDQDVDHLGGVVMAASKTRVGQALISRYSSISDQNVTTHVPADVLLDITMEIVRRGGTPETLQVLADLAGFKLVPRAQAPAEDPATITNHLSDIAKGFSDLTARIAAALPDGLDPVEKADIDEKAAALEIELAELRRDTSNRVVPITSNGRSAA